MSEPALKPHPSLYEEDFARWTEDQARALSERRFEALDIENLVDEVESLGRSQKHEIRKRLAILLAHLLKWEFQPEKRKYGWRATMMEQRSSIDLIVEDSPSLRSFPASVLERSYGMARWLAVKDTGLRVETFPPDCPYVLGDVLDHAFLPGPPGDGD